jgi:uncharacterized membrane protein SpoIIM required for sporulation
METGTLNSASTEYSQWVTNPNFGIATAAFLIIMFTVILWAFARYIMNTITKKIESIEDELRRLSIRMLNMNEMVKTALNIIIDGNINGKNEDDNDETRNS